MACLHYLYEFHVWHSRVKSSQSRWHSIHQNWLLATSLPSLSRPVSFLFFFIPDSSSLPSDIANYFKPSGRRFHFQLNLVFSADLGVQNGGCSLRPEQFLLQLWVPFKKEFKLNLSLASVNTRWVHPCQVRSVLGVRILVTHLMW